MILEQQVSLASAHAHFSKLNASIDAFEPENILKLSDQEMRSCQISRQKATYLRALSTAVQDGSLIFTLLTNISKKEANIQLTSIKGIGIWTAEVYLMFCLQSKDVLPMGDIALINTIKELKGIADKEAILLQTQKWKPFRSLAAYFLWHYYLRKRNRTAI
jgi:DNA-3-methyladenine glycosylase II